MPVVPAAGVPERTPAVLKVTPEGKDPDSENVGAGVPVAVTVNVPAVPTVKVVLLALVMAGAWFTVSVKLCVAFVPTPFCAVIVIAYVPPIVGVPLSTPVAAVNVTPEGRAPDSFRVGAGDPVAVTVNVPAVPTVKVVLLALVMAGAWFTVSVKLCVAFVPTPFCAVKVIAYVPPIVGVPLSTPVAAVNVTPEGNAPDSLRVGAGAPVAATVNEPAVPAVKVALLALVIAGAWFTVRVKLCVA